MEINKYKGKIIGILNFNNEYYEKLNIDKNIVVGELLEEISFKSTIYERLVYEIERRNLKIKDYQKKLEDSLKIVGLKVSLDRNINTLSESEKKQLQIAILLLINPDILVFVEPLKQLDLKNTKKLLRLINKLREQYKKTIVFITNDVNILYKYTEVLLILKKDNLLRVGNTKEILEDIVFLDKHKIEIPEMVEFIHLARRKYNIKLDYHDDIRDIIKDVYKHI